ncbi:MAG: hypothetical protein GX136_09020, partial [Clostridiales bacterium]|nr:hypothetical protein [Clostridiales bacterium]
AARTTYKTVPVRPSPLPLTELVKVPVLTVFEPEDAEPDVDVLLLVVALVVDVDVVADAPDSYHNNPTSGFPLI